MLLLLDLRELFSESGDGPWPQAFLGQRRVAVARHGQILEQVVVLLGEGAADVGGRAGPQVEQETLATEEGGEGEFRGGLVHRGGLEVDGEHKVEGVRHRACIVESAMLLGEDEGLAE